MTDSQIIDLYLSRSEEALQATLERYGSYCFSISLGILKNRQDAEECLNDMLQKCWESIPKAPPENLRAYLSVMIRNLSISRYRWNRSHCQDVALNELRALPGSVPMDDRVCDAVLIEACVAALCTRQNPDSRELFLRRYLEGLDIRALAAAYGLTESCVKIRLLRMRRALKLRLEQCGMAVG